ncbi:MAG TPA: hypothetical protein VF950_13600 [Planctomycetota bacterium]
MIKLLMLLALPLFAIGCVVHGHGHGPALSIEAGHVHSDHCGHYHYRGGWYHSRHSHGPGCGHHYRGGMWVHID